MQWPGAGPAQDHEDEQTERKDRMSDETQDGPTPEDAGLAGDLEHTPVLTDRVEQVDLQTEMQRSYLDYAMAVIVGRALPDVRDGLKPVHRRVLYAMYDGLSPSRTSGRARPTMTAMA